jgi:hypothetical protein
MIMLASAFEMENLQKVKNAYRKHYLGTLNIYHHFLATELLLALKKNSTNQKFASTAR